ncbi:MAG: T9SS type A sorting domain-containing protein [Ferruginibacter sp.]
MTGTSSSVAVTNNSITVTGTASQGQVIVIREQDGTGPATIKTITGNIVNVNLPSDVTQCFGFLCDLASGSFSNNQWTFNTAGIIQVSNFQQTVGSGGGFTIDNNSFSLTSSGLNASVIGIIAPAPASGSYTISNNTFTSLSASNTGASSPLVSAIAVSGGTNNNIFGNTISGSSTGAGSGNAIITAIDLSGGTTNNVYRNKIYGLSTANTGTTSLITAIRVGGGISTHNIYNNLIGFSGTFGAMNSTDAIRGIGITSTVDNSVINVANNTIYINANSTGANFGTTGIYHAANATSTTATLDLRNNIIVNLSVPNGTGITSALARSVAATYGNYAPASNRNFLFAGTPGLSNAILNDNGTTIGSFTAFQSAIAPAEANSFTDEGFAYATPGAYFINFTGSDINFLHLVAGTATKAESGASPVLVPPVTDDYDGQTRNTTTPDVGADEFSGTNINTSIINVTVPVGTCTVTSHLINADVVVGNGTVTSVTLDYDNGAAGSVAMIHGSGNTYSATIPAGTPGVTVTWTITVVASNGPNTVFNGVSYTDEALSSSQIMANVVQPTCAVATGSITVTSPLGAGFTYSITAPSGPFQSSPSFPAVSPGTYTLYVQNSLNCIVAAPSTITINPQPTTITAPTVTGTVNVCPFLGNGVQVVYTASSPGATSYTWVLPPNVNLISGGSPSNSITVTFNTGFSSQANRQIKVTATASCGTSSQTIYYLLTQSPGTPTPITGPTNVCSLIGTANTATYTINKSASATGYIWTIPGLGTTTSVVNPGSGANDTSVIVTFLTGFGGGTITVTATNGCGTSGSRSLIIANAIPSTPGPISGPTNACPYIAPTGTTATYSITPVSSATSYTWTVLPATAVVTHPNGTGANDYTITVLYPAGFTTGSVSVVATNGCGTSGNRSKSITKLNPGTPGAIDVIQTHFCGEAGGRKYTYELASLPANTTTLVWTVPATASFVNITPIKIEVTYPDAAVTGSVTVQATNGGCVSTIRSVAVSLPACPPPGFAGGSNSSNGDIQTKQNANLVPKEKSMEVKVFPNPAVSDFKLQVLTAGSEEINVTILDNLGRVCKTFSIMPYQTIAVGTELKPGSYLIKLRQGAVVKTARIVKF